MKNILLYFAIFILLILLFLPWGLRTFAKDIYKPIEKPKDVIESISCNKLNETMNISYLNGKTYNIFYNITGNYETEIENNAEVETTNNLNPTKDLRSVSQVEYNQVADMTTFKVDLANNPSVSESISMYTRGIDEEINILSQNGFSCSKSVIS